MSLSSDVHDDIPYVQLMDRKRPTETLFLVQMDVRLNVPNFIHGVVDLSTVKSTPIKPSSRKKPVDRDLENWLEELLEEEWGDDGLADIGEEEERGDDDHHGDDDIGDDARPDEEQHDPADLALVPAPHGRHESPLRLIQGVDLDVTKCSIEHCCTAARDAVVEARRLIENQEDTPIQNKRTSMVCQAGEVFFVRWSDAIIRRGYRVDIDADDNVITTVHYRVGEGTFDAAEIAIIDTGISNHRYKADERPPMPPWVVIMFTTLQAFAFAGPIAVTEHNKRRTQCVVCSVLADAELIDEPPSMHAGDIYTCFKCSKSWHRSCATAFNDRLFLVFDPFTCPCCDVDDMAAPVAAAGGGMGGE